MRVALLALLLCGAAAAQSFTVTVDVEDAVRAGVQVLGRDVLDAGGVRVSPAVQLLVSGGAARVYSGVMVFYAPSGARYAWSARVMARVGWDGERLSASPALGVVWTWRP